MGYYSSRQVQASEEEEETDCNCHYGRVLVCRELVGIPCTMEWRLPGDDELAEVDDAGEDRRRRRSPAGILANGSLDWIMNNNCDQE